MCVCVRAPGGRGGGDIPKGVEAWGKRGRGGEALTHIYTHTHAHSHPHTQKTNPRVFFEVCIGSKPTGRIEMVTHTHTYIHTRTHTHTYTLYTHVSTHPPTHTDALAP